MKRANRTLYGNEPGARKEATSDSHGTRAKDAMVDGTMMTVWAKMIGITPAVISRIGMKVFWPSRTRPRPITFRGIWIGNRRAAIVIATTAATMPTSTTRKNAAGIGWTRPSLTYWAPW